MSSSKESRFPNCIYFLPCRIKEHVDLLWEEFNIPIWLTEFNWNKDDVWKAKLMFIHKVNRQLSWVLICQSLI